MNKDKIMEEALEFMLKQQETFQRDLTALIKEEAICEGRIHREKPTNPHE